MSKTSSKYGIIVAVDGSAESDAAIAWAGREASMRREHITLMHVAHLVVLGSHGRGGFAGMRLGAVGTAVAQSATVPVIVVRT